MDDLNLTYRGVLLSDIEVNDVDWTGREEHLRQRSVRTGDLDELDVEPEWATEAATDPNRLARERDSGSLEVIGWSPSAPGTVPGRKGRVLRVWVRPARDDVRSGHWIGGSACAAAPEVTRIYEAEMRRKTRGRGP